VEKGSQAKPIIRRVTKKPRAGQRTIEKIVRGNALDLSIHAIDVSDIIRENSKRKRNIAKAGYVLTDMDDLEWKQSGVSNGVFMAIKAKRDGQAQGVLKLEPNAVKEPQRTAKYDTSYTVTHGVISLTIEEQPEVLIKTLASFQLRPGTLYSLRNLRNDAAYVSFVVTKV
jgi:hypothetical protein